MRISLSVVLSVRFCLSKKGEDSKERLVLIQVKIFLDPPTPPPSCIIVTVFYAFLILEKFGIQWKPTSFFFFSFFFLGKEEKTTASWKIEEEKDAETLNTQAAYHSFIMQFVWIEGISSDVFWQKINIDCEGKSGYWVVTEYFAF